MLGSYDLFPMRPDKMDAICAQMVIISGLSANHHAFSLAGKAGGHSVTHGGSSPSLLRWRVGAVAGGWGRHVGERVLDVVCTCAVTGRRCISNGTAGVVWEANGYTGFWRCMGGRS